MAMGKHRIRIIRRFVLGIVLLCFGLGVYWVSQTGSTGVPQQEFEITKGMRLKDVVEQLDRKGLIKNRTLTEYIFYRRRLGAELKEGFFTLNGTMTPSDIASVLEGVPHFPFVYVLVPEGKRMNEVIDLIVASGFDQKAELDRATGNVGLSPYTSGRKNLEGFLFPAKYAFLPKTTAQEKVEAMVRRMSVELTPERIDRAKRLGLSVYSWVTLASLVQAEAGSKEEMPQIAGVFLNRLEREMRLQSDPTVAYGLGIALQQLNRSRGDFEKMTPYNTYRRSGLPPTPIGNPGLDALLAVLNPVRTTNGQVALYFLHGRDGSLHVNAKFSEHVEDNTQFR